MSAPLRGAWGLWPWAAEAYGRPGVEAICLELQDSHGQNAPLLLWAIWAADTDPDLMRQAAQVARRWEQTVVGQLRVARRALKTASAPIAEAGRERLRQDVKAAELAAERLLLEALEMITPAHGRASAVDALKAAATAWGGSEAVLEISMALAALAQALAPQRTER